MTLATHWRELSKSSHQLSQGRCMCIHVSLPALMLWLLATNFRQSVHERGCFNCFVACKMVTQCSPCNSNLDTTNFLLIRRFLESRHIYNTKNSNGMSRIIRSRISLVYVHTWEYQSFLITCVRLRYLRRPRSWG